jgi:hypothetical protein
MNAVLVDEGPAPELEIRQTPDLIAASTALPEIPEARGDAMQ